MTTPDTPALAALREKEREIIHRAAVAMEQYRIAQLPPRPANSMGFDDKERYAQFKNIQRYEREIRDAVAARVREEEAGKWAAKPRICRQCVCKSERAKQRRAALPPEGDHAE